MTPSWMELSYVRSVCKAWRKSSLSCQERSDQKVFLLPNYIPMTTKPNMTAEITSECAIYPAVCFHCHIIQHIMVCNMSLTNQSLREWNSLNQLTVALHKLGWFLPWVIFYKWSEAFIFSCKLLIPHCWNSTEAVNESFMFLDNKFIQPGVGVQVSKT